MGNSDPKMEQVLSRGFSLEYQWISDNFRVALDIALKLKWLTFTTRRTVIIHNLPGLTPKPLGLGALQSNKLSDSKIACRKNPSHWHWVYVAFSIHFKRPAFPRGFPIKFPHFSRAISGFPMDFSTMTAVVSGALHRGAGHQVALGDVAAAVEDGLHRQGQQTTASRPAVGIPWGKAGF